MHIVSQDRDVVVSVRTADVWMAPNVAAQADDQIHRIYAGTDEGVCVGIFRNRGAAVKEMNQIIEGLKHGDRMYEVRRGD